ncbi:MAG TPA: hypothetical protein DD381_07015 [Lentisphaeria bacterium]|nr:MAG: hypothetical protein A2X47_10890 [Lentisphaerae bacterium GWF2_38_69]HBM16074.1 hypothetical protein [Lentisphaeria bacterium]
MKTQITRFIKRLLPRFKKDARALYEFLQGQNDYVEARNLPITVDWDYEDLLIDFLNRHGRRFIHKHFNKGLLLVCDNGKVRSLDIAGKARAAMIDEISISLEIVQHDERLLKEYSKTKLKKQITGACYEDMVEFLRKYDRFEALNIFINRGLVEA